MHDMSNTRKEIAARLGFAAGNGAKVSFDTYTDMVNELRRFTADSANVQYDWYTAANTWLGRKRTSGNKEIAVEANRAYDAVEREMRPKWRQSRPGAKAEFGFGPAPLKGSPARKAEIAQDKAAAAVRKKALLTKKNVTVLKRIESDYNDAMSGMRELAALMAKKLAYVKSRTVNGDVDAEEYRSVFDEAGTGIGQSIEVLNDYNFSRSGAKAEFGFGPAPLRGSPARKEEIAQDKAAAAARAAARAAALDEEKATIQRKLNILRPRYRELAAYVKAATPRIYDLTRKTYSTPDMKKREKLKRLLDKENAVYKQSEAVFKETAKEMIELEKRARKLGMTLSSRPGAKATMTRDQTEEQKAGLKIMSAADPAVGAKIAKLIKEGKPQDQAVAIALDMKRRGEI